MFSPILPVGCLFILSMLSFAVQKFLSLIKSHLLIFVSFALGDRTKHISIYITSMDSVSVLPLFSWSFMASGLTFKSLEENHSLAHT